MRRTLLRLSRRALFLAALFYVLGASPSLALTLSDIRGAIRRNVRDTASSTSLRRYSDTTLLAYINEAQRAVINDTWAISGSASQASVASQASYSLATDVIKPWRVIYGDFAVPEITLSQLDGESPESDWSSTASQPKYFYRSNASPNSIGFVPKPSVSTATITIYYYALASDLSGDSDIPYNGNLRLYAYHDLLVYHASYRLLASENRLPEASTYQNLYSSGVQLMNINVGNKPIRETAPSKEQTP